jgi:glycosyltransferase involved in cell wall biosynthesis
MQDLPTQAQIMANWPKSFDTPLVSICCVTYNHAHHIHDALHGFLRQKTNFPFEILVHDDASQDGTAQIVQDFAARYPDLFVPILQKENQFSQGRKPSAILFQRARGKFIALCEGDDYWIDPEKLIRQVAVLRARPDLDLCSHAIQSDTEARSRARERLSDSIEQEFGLHEVISKSFALTPTASVMIRAEAALQFAQHVATRPELPFGDIYMKFFGTLRGGGIFINRQMAFYRRYSAGSWSARSKVNYKMRLASSAALINSYAELDQISEGRIHGLFREEIRNRFHHISKDRRIPIFRRIEFLWRNRALLSRGAWLQYLVKVAMTAMPGHYQS